MNIQVIQETFSICKVTTYTDVAIQADYCFIGKTDEECSLVCLTRDVPSHTLARDDGWRAFRLEGVLDFSLIGILSAISSLLAQAHIGIFAVSTYNTDYIFVKQKQLDKALQVLQHEGYTIVPYLK